MLNSGGNINPELLKMGFGGNMQGFGMASGLGMPQLGADGGFGYFDDN